MSSGTFEDDQDLIESAALIEDEGPWQQLAAALDVALVPFLPTGCEIYLDDDDVVDLAIDALS